jgi:hypothetical protein
MNWNGCFSPAMMIFWLKRPGGNERAFPFRGGTYAHLLRVSIGRCVHDLEIIAKAGEPEDLLNRVQFLPL